MTRNRFSEDLFRAPERQATCSHAAALFCLIVMVILAVSLGAAEEQGRLINFDQYHFGIVPNEFVYDATGPHGPVLSAGRPLWRVYSDRFAPSPQYVLIQASALPKPDHYPIALLRGFQAADVTLSVSVKLMGGEYASAGVLWRARNKDNYYAVLASARTGQVSLLAMQHGLPRVLSAARCPIEVEFEHREPSPSHGWYLLEVASRNGHHTVRFRGEKVLEVEDSTIQGAGQVGLITHADSVALFDDFGVRELPADRRLTSGKHLPHSEK